MSQAWTTYIGPLSQTFTASTFTPDTAITVTRIEVRLRTAPAGCATTPRVRVTDGTTAQVVTINSAYENSGALALNYAAGVPISLQLNREAAGCTTEPRAANIVVQYRQQ
jgi:hypothetical protein